MSKDNSARGWNITATILDEKRLESWKHVFPDGVLPIVTPIARRVCVPKLGEADVYMLDLGMLSSQHTELLCKYLSERFSIPLDEARVEIHRGVPILANGVKVEVHNYAWGGPALFDDFGFDDDEVEDEIDD